MAKGATKLPDRTLVSAAELGEIAGVDPETVNNWLRRSIVKRTSIGGRRLRSRLFSTDEVYKAALTMELVGLGIAPSPASIVVNKLWKEWQQSDLKERQHIYAALIPNNRQGLVISWWKKQSGGALRQLSSGSDAVVFDLLRQAFAVIPISDVVAEVEKRMALLPVEGK
jgi:hypothetical protein